MNGETTSDVPSEPPDEGDFGHWRYHPAPASRSIRSDEQSNVDIRLVDAGSFERIETHDWKSRPELVVAVGRRLGRSRSERLLNELGTWCSSHSVTMLALDFFEQDEQGKRTPVVTPSRPWKFLLRLDPAGGEKPKSAG